MAKTKATSKKRNVRVDAVGQLHVHSSFNNIIVSFPQLKNIKFYKDGAAGENRTHDPILTKDVLYH